MLNHSRDLVLQREHRHGRRTVYAPRIRWAAWLYSGGGEAEALPTIGRKANRQGTSDEGADDADDTPNSDSKESLLAGRKNDDLEKIAGLDNVQDKRKNQPEPAAPHNSEMLKEHRHTQQPKPPLLCLRGHLADFLEWLQGSDDFLYAIKITVAVFLVIWPSLIASWNTWYSLNRGCK